MKKVSTWDVGLLVGLITILFSIIGVVRFFNNYDFEHSAVVNMCRHPPVAYVSWEDFERYWPDNNNTNKRNKDFWIVLSLGLAFIMTVFALSAFGMAKTCDLPRSCSCRARQDDLKKIMSS